MSLQDTDPNTTNRIEPTPQAMDQNPTRVSDGTTAITNKQDGSSGAYVSTKDATVKVNDGTDNRVTLGLLSDGSYGLKVSQPGFDVLSAADDELIFNSSQNVFKIVGIITGTFPGTGAASPPVGGGGAQSTANTQIAHGLGLVPAFIAYGGDAGVNFQQPWIQMGTFSTNGMYVHTQQVTADATNITLTSKMACYGPFGSSVSGAGMTVKVYLLQETAN